MQYINQRLTESEKAADDYQAAKDVLDYLIPAFHSSSNWMEEYKTDLSNYRLVNNIIEIDEFEKVCNPFGIKESFYEDEILPYNKIPTKINLALGEELKRNENYAATLLDDSSVMEKDIEHEELFIKWSFSEMDKVFKKIIMKHQGASEEEIQRELEQIQAEYTPEEIQSYKSELEIMANAILRYGYQACDMKEKKKTGFKHTLITDKEIVYVGIINGKPDFETVNPLHFFAQKGPEVDNYEDGDWAGRRMVMTLNQVSRIYGNSMNEEDYKRLYEYGTDKGGTEAFNVGKKGQIFPNYYKQTFNDIYGSLGSNADKHDYVGSYGSGNSGTYFEEDLIWVTHLTWKWERKIGFLTIYDEFGDADTTIVDSEYPIPKEHEKINYINRWGVKARKKLWYSEDGLMRFELEEMWIPRVWEATRIGEDIYVNIREVPNQPISINSPFDVKLPYIGKTYTAMNAPSVSPVSRMKPFQFLYFVVMHQMVKMIARNYGSILKLDTSQIDLSLGDGDPDLAIQRTLLYLREGIALYNSLKDAETQSDVNMTRPATDVVSYSNTTDIANLIVILDWLDRQIGMGFGISPEREGNFQAYSNVSDNRQTLMQSSNMTEVYFYKHNEIWKNVMQYYVNMFRLWAKDQFERNPDKDSIILQYVLPNGDPSSFIVTPDMVSSGDIGLFITNYGAAESYFDKMEQLALTFIQNERASFEDISMLIKSRIDGTSPEEVHKQIVNLEKAKREIDSERAKIGQQNADDAFSREVQMKTLEHEHKLIEIRLEESLNKDTKLAVEEAKEQQGNNPNNN